MNTFFTLAIALLLAISTSLPARSDDSKHHATPAAGDMADAEVRKVDGENKKITLKHGEIKNLDMPAMTMVFQVNDRAMLERFKAGDRVRFKAEKVGGAYTVTAIEIAK